MLSPDFLNPFLIHRADDTVTLPPGHVTDLQGKAVRDCLSAIRQSHQVKQALGLVLIGEAGSGKSQLLAHLRHRLVATPLVVFTAIRLNNAFSGRLWRPLRTRLVEELMRPLGVPGLAPNGLLRILNNQFPRWGEQAQGASGQLLDWQMGRAPDADLRPHLEEFQMLAPLDSDLTDVLPQLGDRNTHRLALNWLKGAVHHPEHLQRLGLAPQVTSEAEQEAAAQEVVLSLLRLAGRSTVLVVSFDEVEAIQAGNWDALTLRSFATLLTTLLSETGHRVVLTSLRPNLFVDLHKVAEKSNVEKFAQLKTTMLPLGREQMDQLVKARLDALPALHAERAKRPEQPWWPFTDAFLDATFQSKQGLTPRQVILACHTEFERLRGRAAEPSTVGSANEVARSPAVSLSFNRAWETRRDNALNRPASVHFDHTMATGLPWLAGLLGLPYVLSEQPPQGLGDVNLYFNARETQQKGVLISFCNHQPTQLWRRLDRLLKQWKPFRERTRYSLIVLRSELERATDAAATRFAELEQLGALTLRVERQALAELAAYQGLMTSIGLGEVVHPRGTPVTMEEYNCWACQHLSGAVKEFLDQVFGPLSPPRTAGGAARAVQGRS